MIKVVKCDSCQELLEFELENGSEPGAWGECSSCKAEIGLDPESRYYKCQCGRGLYALSTSEIGDGVWLVCRVCSSEYSVIPQSSRSGIYACRQCGSKSRFDSQPGDFECNCGARLRSSLDNAKKGQSCRCPSCQHVWTAIDTLWKLPCGCGFIDSATKLPNQIQCSTPGKVGLSETALTSFQQAKEVKSPSRVDEWLNRAFKAGDPVSMVANFVVETAAIGSDAYKESQQIKSENLPAEIRNFLIDGTRIGSQIAEDHLAANIQVDVGYRVDETSPSLASGVGQLTETLVVVLRISFSPQKRPIQRTRKFTVFNPETGKEIWPGARMDIDGDSCFFQLHVGSALNQGWGVIATWRNNNLKKVFSQLTNFVDNCSADTFAPYSRLPITGFHSSHW